MFINFKDLKKFVSKLLTPFPFKRVRDIHFYTYEQYPEYTLCIRKPINTIDTYLDIIGQVTLYYSTEVIFDRLICIDTDLEKLCVSILQNLSEDRVKRK